MQKPLQITLRGMDNSTALEQRIREKVAALERFADSITSCHVTVEAPHHHQRQGNAYAVQIAIHVPDKQFVFGSKGSREAEHEDVYIAVRDAFATATRGLNRYLGERRQH
jgi:ribosomal subunit interface protein